LFKNLIELLQKYNLRKRLLFMWNMKDLT
jgi:hypothetical protein